MSTSDVVIVPRTPARAGAGGVGKKNRKQATGDAVKAWALDRKAKLATATAVAGMGSAGDILSTAPDGWRTALALGAAGTAAAGAWGWLPGLIRWRGRWVPARSLPGERERRIALSMPITGSALLTTIAATGGPEWGANPWWGFSLAWSAAYGTWLWRRWGRAPEATAPAATQASSLAQQILDWSIFAAAPAGPYPGSTLVSPLSDPKGGWSAEIHTPRSRSFRIANLDDVLSSLDINDPDLVALEKIGPRRGRITVFTENPLKKGTTFGPGHAVDPDTGLAPYGVYYDGVPANYRFWQPGSGGVHDFITGTTGSGKSRVIDGLLGIERRSPLMCSVVIDPQHGLSLPDWPDGVAVFSPGNDLGIVVLRAMHELMKERGKRYNRMKWVDDKGRTRIGRAFFVPGDPDPFVCITLEEAHDMLNDPEHGPEAVKIVGDIAKESRKTGFKIRIANQSPNASELGGDTLIRSMLQGGNNLVMRSGDSATGKRAAGNALGDIDPGSIPKEFNDGSTTAGLGYFAGPDNRAAMWRAPYVEDPFGIAHDGETTGFEQDSIDALPLLRHILAEHALMLELRNAGREYAYDPERFTESSAQPSVKKAPTVAEPSPSAPVQEEPGLSATGHRIVHYLLKRGTPAAPAVIARDLGLPGPQIRKALTRMKDRPSAPVVNIGLGAWVHADHAAEYSEAA